MTIMHLKIITTTKRFMNMDKASNSRQIIISTSTTSSRKDKPQFTTYAQIAEENLMTSLPNLSKMPEMKSNC